MNSFLEQCDYFYDGTKRTASLLFSDERKIQSKLPIDKTDFIFDHVLSSLLNGVKA